MDHTQILDLTDKDERSSNRIVGNYTMKKTLDAGGLNKQKLATHNITGENFAIKVVPRFPALSGSATSANPSHEAALEHALVDALKETRTLRETALSMLLHHPNICGIREMIVHQRHYYMVFEYLSGGQMLDYVITHGRILESVARKFARQIGSALYYCHRNNIVHRNIKIENILLSHTGDVKITHFKYSNVYDPNAHLLTLCGSTYFHAPEIVDAKPYTGPEIDVWSFGVVLYILVCGHVPFDDKDILALHAKIKRGVVKYPSFLSADCKNLLSRMLSVNPDTRATLFEVLNHPWMRKGFSGPPDSHLAHREPLRADQLDRQVIRSMTGFEFGSEEDIERKLTQVLESDAYIHAVQVWQEKHDEKKEHATSGKSVSNPPSSISADAKSESPTSKKLRRFSGFGFISRKLFPPTDSAPSGDLSRPSVGDADSIDPTAGFHPLVSVYYLAREKLERDRA